MRIALLSGEAYIQNVSPAFAIDDVQRNNETLACNASYTFRPYNPFIKK